LKPIDEADKIAQCHYKTFPNFKLLEFFAGCTLEKIGAIMINCLIIKGKKNFKYIWKEY